MQLYAVLHVMPWPSRRRLPLSVEERRDFAMRERTFLDFREGMKSPWNHAAVFSQQTPHHATPETLFVLLNREFGFDLDPCPLRDASTGGLSISWKGRRVFCNPPYGPRIGLWLEKGREADVAVYLLPARTDTIWWHRYAPHAEVRFIKGRLRFNEAGRAPFPSVILIFRARSEDSHAKSELPPAGPQTLKEKP